MKYTNIEILKSGGVGVLLTDTLFGIVGQALNQETVKRIYKIKKRNPSKPLIILISSIEDLNFFGVKVDKKLKLELDKNWPGSISIILPCKHKKFSYLHRGTSTLAFRFPRKSSLLKILKETGPLVAPSANPESLLPAENITKAKEYFGDQVDFYSAGSKPKSKASKIIRVYGSGKIKVIRR